MAARQGRDNHQGGCSAPLRRPKPHRALGLLSYGLAEPSYGRDRAAGTTSAAIGRVSRTGGRVTHHHDGRLGQAATDGALQGLVLRELGLLQPRTPRCAAEPRALAHGPGWMDALQSPATDQRAAQQGPPQQPPDGCPRTGGRVTHHHGGRLGQAATDGALQSRRNQGPSLPERPRLVYRRVWVGRCSPRL